MYRANKKQLDGGDEACMNNVFSVFWPPENKDACTLAVAARTIVDAMKLINWHRRLLDDHNI